MWNPSRTKNPKTGGVLSSRILTPWLKSSVFDACFLLFPPFLALILAWYFDSKSMMSSDLPEWAWLIFILGIDVTHVYSTLFRSYFNREEIQENKNILILTPVLVWLVGVALYSISAMAFWRTLTYVAVFHFIRQQYGFLRLYTRTESLSQRHYWIDQILIYTVTLYPIVHWHTELPREFHWFMEGDFFAGLPTFFGKLAFGFYIFMIGLYFVHEGVKLKSGRPFNLPKNILVLSTTLTWYFGIIYFNNDLIFTMTNVIAHGVPYIALVWFYGERHSKKISGPFIFGKLDYRCFFVKFSLPLFLGFLFILGYLEEGLWAGFIWREHLEIFKPFAKLPLVSEKDSLSILIPLLTVPQATHYVLDGFIWKVRNAEAHWQKVIFS